VFAEPAGGGLIAFPDTCVGTDSHTTMIGAVGVVGWGVGASRRGVPARPAAHDADSDVVGFKLTGELPTGATATDLVLTITQILRKHGVVEKFVEFSGRHALARGRRPRDDREHGAGVRRDDRLLPGRREDLEYLHLSAGARRRSRWSRRTRARRACSRTRARRSRVQLRAHARPVDGGAVPGRTVAPQDRVPLDDVARDFKAQLPKLVGGKAAPDAAALARTVRVGEARARTSSATAAS